MEDDKTGTVSIQDMTRAILEGNNSNFGEIVFMLDGKRINLEAIITHIDGIPMNTKNNNIREC